MVQVVTNENMQQLISAGKVPEFKAPEPAKTETKAPAGEVKEPAGEPAPAPRDDQGKFVAKEEDKAVKAASEEDDGEDKDLTEKVRKLIGKKHRAMKEAEEFAREEYRERKAAEERVAALQREIDELKTPKSGPASDGDEKEPDPKDFETVGEYAKAYAKYEVAQARKADRAETEKLQQQQTAEQAQSQFIERLQQARKDIADYDEVVGEADGTVPPHVAQYIIDSPLGAQIGYHLAKHPDIHDRITKLSPIRAIAELGKLEASLEKKPEPEKKAESAPAVSRAPAPITPLNGTTTPVHKDPKDMTFQELREHRLAERRAKGRG